MDIYVTYLTIYSGNKLPPFYIGSSSKNKVLNGYHGSVGSKKYKTIWKQELIDNPHLFKTRIISEHNDRQDALNRELILQQKLNVVKSPMYINMSLAKEKGYIGLSLLGKDNPRYGQKHSEQTLLKMRESAAGRKLSESSILKRSLKQSHNYMLTDPVGNVYIINHSISKFCEDNKLSLAGVYTAAKRKSKTHKGWRCEFYFGKL